MAVGREIEVAIRTEGGKHLVARGVDRLAEVLHTAHAVGGELYAPDVESAHAAGHVADKVEPHIIGRDGRMGKERERVLGDFKHLGLGPGGIASLGGGYLGVARIVGVGLADGQVHGLPVDGEGAGPLVQLRIQFPFCGFWLEPLALVVLCGEENVGRLGAGNTAQFVALCLVAGRGEVELVVVVACQHGRILSPSRVEEVLLLDGIAGEGGILFPLRSLAGRHQSRLYQRIVGHRVE